jgi:hypothetical protein
MKVGRYYDKSAFYFKLIRSSDVQQFAVWEHDSKDESGFVGYCYLDLFPRGALIPPPLVSSFHQSCSSKQVLPCRRLATSSRLRPFRWTAFLPPRCYGG